MKFKIGLIVLLVLAREFGIAQQQELLSPAELKQKTVVTEPQTLYKGFWRSGISANYGFNDKHFNAEGDREALDNNGWFTNWSITPSIIYGISDRLQVEAQIPYRFVNIHVSYLLEIPDRNLLYVQESTSKGNGLGDLVLATAYQIIMEKNSRPSFTGYLYVTLPTGEKNPTNIKSENDYDRPTGSGEAAAEVVLRLRKVNFPYSYSFYAGYEVFFGGEKMKDYDPMDPTEYSFKSGNRLNVAAYHYFHLNDWIAFRNSFDYFFFAKDEFDGVKDTDSSWVIQYSPGLSFQIKNFRIDQAVVVPLVGKSFPADPSYLVGLQYTF